MITLVAALLLLLLPHLVSPALYYIICNSLLFYLRKASLDSGAKLTVLWGKVVPAAVVVVITAFASVAAVQQVHSCWTAAAAVTKSSFAFVHIGLTPPISFAQDEK